MNMVVRENSCKGNFKKWGFFFLFNLTVHSGDGEQKNNAIKVNTIRTVRETIIYFTKMHQSPTAQRSSDEDFYIFKLPWMFSPTVEGPFPPAATPSVCAEKKTNPETKSNFKYRGIPF